MRSRWTARRSHRLRTVPHPGGDHSQLAVPADCLVHGPFQRPLASCRAVNATYDDVLASVHDAPPVPRSPRPQILLLGGPLVYKSEELQVSTNKRALQTEGTDMSVHQIPPETDEGDEFEEPENAVLRRELGLRPIGYPDSGDHPDQRPCPSWCWIAHEEEYEHEVDCRHPLEALHTLEPHPSVVASLYPGDSSRGPGPGGSTPRRSSRGSSRSDRRTRSSTWPCASTRRGNRVQGRLPSAHGRRRTRAGHRAQLPHRDGRPRLKPPDTEPRYGRTALFVRYPRRQTSRCFVYQLQPRAH